jgi:hypothetical protein
LGGPLTPRRDGDGQHRAHHRPDHVQPLVADARHDGRPSNRAGFIEAPEIDRPTSTAAAIVAPVGNAVSDPGRRCSVAAMTLTTTSNVVSMMYDGPRGALNRAVLVSAILLEWASVARRVT